MRTDNPDRYSRSTCRLANLDLAAHGAAIVSSATGGILLESVVLMAAASHHVASVGFALLISERRAEQTHSWSGDAMFSAVQLILWTCCLLLASRVAALGAHDMFHAKTLDYPAMAVYAIPGAIAAVTSAALVRSSVHNGLRMKANAFLSALPTVSALCIAAGAAGVGAGRVDALAGLAIVVLLCIRALAYVADTLD